MSTQPATETTPSFFERHNNAVLATSAATLAVAALAIGLFAMISTIPLYWPLIPFSLIGAAATITFTLALIERRPIIIQKNPPSPTPSSDSSFQHVSSGRASVASSSGAGDVFLDATDIPFKPAKEYISDLTLNTQNLFENGTKIFKAFIKLYAHVYSVDETARTDAIRGILTSLQESISQKLMDDSDFLVWMALDSLFSLSDHCVSYRSGKKTAGDILNLLKTHANGDDAICSLLDTWFKGIDLKQKFSPQTTVGRQALVTNYNRLSDDSKAELTEFFCGGIQLQLESYLLEQWRKIKGAIIDAGWLESTAFNAVVGRSPDTLSEEDLKNFTGLKAALAAVQNQSEEEIKNSPLAQFIEPFFRPLSEQLRLPICRAKHTGSKLHSVVKELLSPKTNLDESSIPCLGGTLAAAVEGVVKNKIT
ncbi:MAG: hypothetical protein S4CHLAM45_00560 [Chlamydiales bacterium]|nr:hypothetical protein [Chlamydiales bacterium]MCH9619378.1 hypothetical protein [Chlamydiales bacterium]MCH9622182.1 hypothetical protein [Chlamydiales bacterium]